MRDLLRDIATELRAKHGGDRKAVGLAKLPLEVLDMVVDQADWLFSYQTAKEYSFDLSREYSSSMRQLNENLFEALFTM